MSEREMADPQTYRGGVEEPEEAKGGAPGGVVPRDMVDEPVSPPSDEQELSDEALGGFADEEPERSGPARRRRRRRRHDATAGRTRRRPAAPARARCRTRAASATSRPTTSRPERLPPAPPCATGAGGPLLQFSRARSAPSSTRSASMRCGSSGSASRSSAAWIVRARSARRP